MIDEKDRLGDKLRDLEMAREDQWAAQRDRELLENLRRKEEALRKAADQLAKAAEDVLGTPKPSCPRCQQPLNQQAHKGLNLLTCPAGHGAWLDSAELERLT